MIINNLVSDKNGGSSKDLNSNKPGHKVIYTTNKAEEESK
jgi:hypothetical protein